MLHSTRAIFTAAAIFTLIGCLAALYRPAHADARVDLSFSLGGANGPAVSFTTLEHGSVERQEMNVTSPITAHLVALADCGSDTYTVMDPTLKLYASIPLSQQPIDQLGIASVQSLLQPPSGAASTAKAGTITNTVHIKDLGMDTPPGLTGSAHHFHIDTVRVATGAAGDSTLVSHSELWTDPALMRPSCPAREQSPRTIVLPSGAQVTYTLAGDADLYNHIARFLPVEAAVSIENAGTTTITRTSSALTPQDPSLFSVPTGFKKVTMAEFATAEQNAVLDQLSGPQPKLPTSK